MNIFQKAEVGIRTSEYKDKLVKEAQEREQATQFTSETGKKAVYRREHPEERLASADASRSQDDSKRVLNQMADVWTGIQVDNCWDIGRIMDVHFWNFWSGAADIARIPGSPALSLEAYTFQNAFSLVFYRTGWEVVQDVFSWGYHVGMM